MNFKWQNLYELHKNDLITAWVWREFYIFYPQEDVHKEALIL